MNLKLKRTPGVYLVGFMASGKSTVGRHLARRMGWSFFDTDEEIASAEGVSIAEIFETRGEAEFRRIESLMIARHLQWIENGRPAVIALGGGAFAEAANRERLENNGVTVWLDCPFEIVRQRLGNHGPVRPLAADAEKFALLYRTRRADYQLADVRIEISSDDPEITVDTILTDPAFK